MNEIIIHRKSEKDGFGPHLPKHRVREGCVEEGREGGREGRRYGGREHRQTHTQIHRHRDGHKDTLVHHEKDVDEHVEEERGEHDAGVVVVPDQNLHWDNHRSVEKEERAGDVHSCRRRSAQNRRGLHFRV